jgi:2-polyprenyl-3-methyl-5-hydroxy-6-metoxy-1,4-benzoquinol methylase
MHDVLEPLPRHRYGLILAIDVLEHVTDLSGCLKKLHNGLSAGGSLIVTQSFSPEDPLHIPQWFKYNDLKLFNHFMKEHGFIYRGRIKTDPISAWIQEIIRHPFVLYARLSRKVKGGGNLLLYKKS